MQNARFVGKSVLTTVVGMLAVSVLPTKVVGLHVGSLESSWTVLIITETLLDMERILLNFKAE